MCSIGIESYNPDNLGWLGKAYTLNYLSNLNNLSKYKITSRVSFMVGLPNDTYNNKGATQGAKRWG
ncbi:hypothetical protein AGMMS49942_19990 [Spirochaetia bacterium]|nr:hypothetical protein AGMMS49942_19990 [Spirochaetia bacterium]